jgi:hypothetical protein
MEGTQMKKYSVIFGVLVMVLSMAAPGIYADERPAYDIILVIDKSISMEESHNLGTVKDFLSSSVIEDKVKIGDFLIIMDFWGQAEIVDSFTIETKADKARAKSVVAAIASTKRETNTDIGNAIDIAKVQIDAMGCTTHPKIVYMVTDGVQEAPRFSKYYSADGKFTNAFLSQATTIAKQGWKIQVIEIGGAKDFIGTGKTTSQAGTDKTTTSTSGQKGPEQGLKETTEKMGGDYTGVSDKPTTGELNQTTADFETQISANPAATRLVVSGNRLSDLTLKLKGQGMAEDAVVVVNEVRLTSSSIQDRNILPSQTIQFNIPKNGETEITARLDVPKTLAPGDYPADIQFYFEGDKTFNPKAFTVTLHVNNFLEDNVWLFIVLLAAGLLLLAFIVFLIIKLIVSSGIKFRLKVEEQPLKKGKDVFKVGYGKWLYLNESYGRLSIAPKRSLRSIGRVYGQKKGLEFEPLREEQFPGLKAAKQNILGHKITVKTQDSVTLHVEFIKV